jgi:hypothetical protein
VAASMCTSCGGSIPDGYAFCPTCGQPVVAPAPVVPLPLATGRLVFLFINAALLILFAALGLLAVVAPPEAGADPAVPTAMSSPSPTSAATEDAQVTPTTLGTAVPGKSPTVTPTRPVGSPPTATPTETQPTLVPTSTPTATPDPTATATPNNRT